MAYLRTVCKKSFFKNLGPDQRAQAESGAKKILMTKPTNLFYEMYIFNYYQ